MTRGMRLRGMRLRAAVATAIVVLAGGGASVAAFGLGDGGSGTQQSTLGLPPATTPITRSDLAASKTLPGQLAYGASATVGGPLKGTATWLPDGGATVSRGEPLYRVDELPVIAMYGTIPMYRPLKWGDKGRDVQQFNDNLRALGYDAPDGDKYTSATADAVRAWQRKNGLERTGEVELGRVVFLAGPVRVAAHKAPAGGPAGAEMLETTGGEKTVTSELDVGDQALAVPGAVVDVGLPNGKTVKGTITDVQTVTPPKDGAGSGASGGDDKPKTKIKVTVEITDQAALAGLEAATVDVRFTSRTVNQALSVPVTALVALPGGGYGVQVVEDGRTRTVPVTLGLFAQGHVEVAGGDLREGMTVGVPQ